MSCCSRRRSPSSPTCRSRASRASFTTAAMREGGFASESGDAARLKRRMIERVLTRCEDQDLVELEPLLTLLRRFATEAAREEARLFCDGLVADSVEAEDCSVAA